MNLLPTDVCVRAHETPRSLLCGLFALWVGAGGCSEPRFEGPADPGSDASGSEVEDGGSTALQGDAKSADQPRVDALADAKVSPEQPKDGADAATSGAGEDRDAAATDAGMTTAEDALPNSVQPPSWASQLPGQYAARVSTFAKEMESMLSAQIIQLATISQQGSGYELTLQHCDWTSKIPNFARLQVLKPSNLALARQRLTVEGDTFSTEPLEFAQGYEVIAAECDGKANELVTKPAHKTWIAGTQCLCPGPLVPMQANDCRLLDPDADTRPGYSVRFIPEPPLLEAEIWGVSTYYTSFAQGTLSNGKLVAQVKANEQFVQFGCSQRFIECLNFTGTAAICPPQYNSAEFVPLAGKPAPSGGWTCDAILARSGELFPTPAPSVPASCPSASP